MHAPVLVAAPGTTPVSLVEAKAHLNVDFADDDALITGLIAAATDYLDGSGKPVGYVGNPGVLRRAILTQSWRQDFDGFERHLYLPRGPARSITSVRWQALDGTWSTIATTNYALKMDSAGRSFVRFENAYVFPSGLYEIGAVQVEYVAGDGAAPEGIKAAILMLVGHWYANREAVVIGSTPMAVPFSVDALLSSYRSPVL